MLDLKFAAIAIAAALQRHIRYSFRGTTQVVEIISVFKVEITSFKRVFELFYVGMTLYAVEKASSSVLVLARICECRNLLFLCQLYKTQFIYKECVETSGT